MTREEAMKVASEMRQWLLNDREKEALETLIPELKESEDERIRKAIVATIEQCPDDFLNPKNRDKMLAYLERQKEQKPVERSEEDEKTINELCDIIASNAKNGYLGGCYAPDLVEKLKSLRPQPKQEWSEKDETIIEGACNALEIHGHTGLASMLKSLRPQPKQEWSKEDEDKIKRLAFLISVVAEKDMISKEECIDLRRFVMSYRPQLKQEWSDEGNACDVDEFNPKPGDKFWVRCKTDKSPWFDKGDERPAYATTNVNGVIIYIVHMNEDGSGNSVSYQDKKKFLETFEIIEKPE